MPIHLTKREITVLIRAGFSDADTANQLNLAPSTVRNHWVSIFNKMGVRGKTQCAIKALRLGLVSIYNFIV